MDVKVLDSVVLTIKMGVLVGVCGLCQTFNCPPPTTTTTITRTSIVDIEDIYSISSYK